PRGASAQAGFRAHWLSLAADAWGAVGNGSARHSHHAREPRWRIASDPWQRTGGGDRRSARAPSRNSQRVDARGDRRRCRMTNARRSWSDGEKPRIMVVEDDADSAIGL